MARELAPVELRSSSFFGAASQPNGSKLPRHKSLLDTKAWSAAVEGKLPTWLNYAAAAQGEPA
ncbi:hypothetical protein FFH90_020250 [Pseudomonas sp. ATCC 43928]|nr:hypothetical protein FFH90_020250 [Pseudomonas sp. ATCC 43928]